MPSTNLSLREMGLMIGETYFESPEISKYKKSENIKILRVY